MYVKPVVSCNSLFACTGKRISTQKTRFLLSLELPPPPKLANIDKASTFHTKRKKAIRTEKRGLSPVTHQRDNHDLLQNGACIHMCNSYVCTLYIMYCDVDVPEVGLT